MVRIVDVRETTVPLRSELSNATMSFRSMTVSVLALVSNKVRDGEPVIGYGFNSTGRYAQGGLLRERLIPRLLAADPINLVGEDGNIDPELIWQAAMRDEKPGGHGDRAVAMGVLDMAAWDLAGKLAGVPLHRLLGKRLRDPTIPDAPLDRVWVYAAGGYYHPEGGMGALQSEMRSYLDLGYRTVKMKIGGAPLAEDLRRIEAVLDVLEPGQRLAVDANGRFDRETALAYAKALSAYDLFWFEEPVEPLDYALHAEVAQAYAGPLATGENLFSMQDARNLLRHGGLRPDRDWLQFDCALSYGLVEYLRTLEAMRGLGWSPSRCIPHGGHQLSLSIAAGLGLGGNESYPDLFQPFGGFPDGVEVEDGHVTIPDLPGIGFEGKADLVREMRTLSG
jgi:L-alanine-DL-glutamate epimerase-like enolase superfamily enzyme